MDTDASFVKRYALVLFFVLAYGFSWGTFFILGGPFVFPLGALLAAFIMASLTGGLKDLLSRLLRWRVGIQWYAAALLVGPAIALAALYLNGLLGAPLPTAAQLGPWYSLFLLFPAVLFDAPFWEETGWRGFALPRFPSTRSPLFNTLILGLLVIGWHLPIALSERAIATPYLIGAFSSAFVTNWVYYNTRGSALLPMLYHTAANTAGPYFFSMFAGSEQVRYFWLLAGVTLVVAVVVILVTGPALQRQPRRPVESAPAL
jgi:membrane protease YdiL (CAAX protease family)